MMDINQMNLFLTKTKDIFNNSIDKAIEFCNSLSKYSVNDKIYRIDNFAFDNNLTEEQAQIILNILCEIHIMKKTERVYKCSNCGLLLGVLSIWDEGDELVCDNCNTIHPYTNECDTVVVYSLYEAPIFKLFTVNWLDKYEKDSNGNPLPRKADIVAFTQSDAESVIHEYYHYIPDSIKVSNGIELENKMLLKEYN